MTNTDLLSDKPSDSVSTPSGAENASPESPVAAEAAQESARPARSRRPRRGGRARKSPEAAESPAASGDGDAPEGPSAGADGARATPSSAGKALSEPSPEAGTAASGAAFGNAPKPASRRRTSTRRASNPAPAPAETAPDAAPPDAREPARPAGLTTHPVTAPATADPVLPAAATAAEPPALRPDRKKTMPAFRPEALVTTLSFHPAPETSPGGPAAPPRPRTASPSPGRDEPSLAEGPFTFSDDLDEETAEQPTPGKRRRSRRGGRGRKRAAAAEAHENENSVAEAAPEAASAPEERLSREPEADEDGDADDEMREARDPAEEATDDEAVVSRKRGRVREKAESETKAKLPPRGLMKMLVSVLPGDEVEVVLTEDGKVREYYVEMMHHAKIRGNIYKGVISNVDANLQAAFVNYGAVKNGFLQIDEVHPDYYLQPHEPGKGRKYPPVQKALKPGQEVIVQVVKEPNGSKGAFLTTWVSLAGRFLVLTPGQEEIGISRKVEDGEERNRLRELIKGLNPGKGLGAIVRTVSAGTSKTTLQKDLSYLKRLWKDINKRGSTEKAPALIHQEPGLASRSVRDYLADDITEVWVDDADTADAIRETASLLFPRKTDLVHLYEEDKETLWEHFGIVKQLEQVHAREVYMPSGGRLVFDQTEALMAIDINSGRISGKTNFEAMAYRTNMEAAETIAEQLRLRDIGGQIVIDFIEMRDPEHCREVEKTLRNAMRWDRARHDIGKMSAFGLLQIVRQRTGTSAISITLEPCPCCNGTGQRRNLEWQAIQTLRDLHRQMRAAVSGGQPACVCAVEPELGLYLLNHKRERLTALEGKFGIPVEVRISSLSEGGASGAAGQSERSAHGGRNAASGARNGQPEKAGQGKPGEKARAAEKNPGKPGGKKTGKTSGKAGSRPGQTAAPALSPDVPPAAEAEAGMPPEKTPAAAGPQEDSLDAAVDAAGAEAAASSGERPETDKVGEQDTAAAEPVNGNSAAPSGGETAGKGKNGGRRRSGGGRSRKPRRPEPQEEAASDGRYSGQPAGETGAAPVSEEESR